jgi:beta-glucanase (GH16 family)
VRKRARRRTLFASIAATVAVMLAGALVIKSMSAPRAGQQEATTANTQASSPSPASTPLPMPLVVGHPALASPPAGGATGSASASQHAGPMVPAGVHGHWKLDFDEEFNGTGLDGNWSTGWFGSGITAPVNHTQEDCYDPAQVSVDGGSLNLTMISKSESCGIDNPRYASGLVSTAGRFTYTYGVLEARVYLPSADGHPGTLANWPAVWTDGQNWPEDGEDDVIEGLGGEACAHFHSSDEPGGVGAGGGNGCAGGSFAGGWHTFAADWEPGQVTYYYDGNEIGSVSQGVTGAPMFIVLSYDSGQAYPQAPATMKVDYVRVWQHS